MSSPSGTGLSIRPGLPKAAASSVGDADSIQENSHVIGDEMHDQTVVEPPPFFEALLKALCEQATGDEDVTPESVREEQNQALVKRGGVSADFVAAYEALIRPLSASPTRLRTSSGFATSSGFPGRRQSCGERRPADAQRTAARLTLRAQVCA